MKSRDLIDLQVMWNRLLAIAEEQAQVLMRTAFSSIVRECADLSAGVFDAQGRMLAQAITGAPGHVNTMAESVRHFMDKHPPETMKPGDAYITNDPWIGTGHLNDFVVTTPCFKNGRVIGFFSSTSHLMDIGGLGFGPDGTDVFMEGLSIPILPLFREGIVNETLMAMIRANTRQPLETEGDTYALAACNDVGCRRLVEMMDEFEIDTLDVIADYIVDRSRQAVLNEIAKLPQGTWHNSMMVDGYDRPLELRAALTVSDNGIAVDFAGTSAQCDRGINVPMGYTKAYTIFGLACAVAGRVPNNAGSLSVFSVTAPSGTVLNAPKPAPVSSRHLLGQMLPDVAFGCLRQIIPDKVPAEGAASLWLLTLQGSVQSDRRTANYGFTLGFMSNGGTGARPSKNGLSATAYPSGVRGTPVEIAEAQSPLVFWRKDLREESAGAGEMRGGFGQVMEIGSRIGEPFRILAAFDRVHFPARGCAGGADGAAGYLGLKSGQRLKGKGNQEIPVGDRLIIMTPGGAGMGDPRQRDASHVARDVADGLISPDAARAVYGREQDATSDEPARAVL
jgi:N-methylhydantoinase B